MPSTAEQDDWLRRVMGVQFDAMPAAGPPKGDFPQPTQGWLSDKIGAVVDKVVTAVTGPNPASPEKSRLMARLATLQDPAGATKEQLAAFAKERGVVTTALRADAPVMGELDTAGKALDRLAGLITACKRTKAVADLSAANPGAGAKATAAFDGFSKVLGKAEVTPEATKKATDDKAAKQKIVDAAIKAIADAKALPDGDPKTAALAKAEKDYKAAKGAFDKADALENAMIGQTSLTTALTSGPLSPSSGGPLKDPAISEKLIGAYSKNARMADAAVTAASTAKFPGVIADQVGPMIDRAQGGFADKNGVKAASQSFNEKYGQDLLKQGGNLGPKYMDRLPDYIASGQQFVAGAAGDGAAATWNGLSQNRSRKVAGAMIKPDGSIDTDSDDAKNAIGNMLFSPDVMKNPTPGLSENVLRTVDMLKDPTTGPQASTVLKGVTAPTGAAAQTLVRGSLGKGPTDAVDETAARTAVMTSMLQPLDQGPVGSCFVTGPARRMRETDPINVMKSYAQLASKGTYKPAVGPELPAITNLPADEDPLMRSYEYTAAAAGARNADSIEHQKLNYDTWQGTSMLKDVATKGTAAKDKDKVWNVKQQKLAKDVADGFTFTYDSTASIGSSADGSSSKGRYVIVHGGKNITTKADFQAAMLEVALASLGIVAGSDEAKEVERIVKSDAFAAKVCPRAGEAPWEMIGGGFAEGTIESLYGTKVTRSDMMPAAATGLFAPAEGERTKQVLSAFLKSFRGNPAEMATIDTAGQHSFNAMPNNPSLDALKGADDAETERKMKTNLLDKGTALKNTDLSADRAGALFDQAVAKATAGLSDPALQKLVDDGVVRYRPKAAVKPADLTRAIQSALEAYQEKKSETDTATWKAGQTTPPSADDEAKHKAALKAQAEKALSTATKNALMKDLGAPEFVIADTNWGSGLDHTYFVIAPDPTSGEPLLWMKAEPPGTLTPAGRDWIDRPWQTFR